MNLLRDRLPVPVPPASDSPEVAAGAKARLALGAGEVSVELHRAFVSVRSEWLALEQRAAGHPYQQWRWLHHWYEQIGVQGKVQPAIILVRDEGGRVQMLLPLVQQGRRGRLGLSRLHFMGAPVSDYQAPLVDACFAARLEGGSIARLLDAVLGLTRADYLVLTHVPPWLGATPNPLGAIAQHPFSEDAHGARLGSQWASYFQQRRSAPTRRRLKEKENALARIGPVVFAEVREPQERTQLVHRLTQGKASQLASTAGPFNTMARSDVQCFFAALAGDPQAEGVHAFQLTAGDMLVAAAFGMMRSGSFYYEVTVYPEPSLKRHSPGSLLLLKMLQWAIEHGCTRFDFTVGDDAYKAEWCDETWPLRCGTRARTTRGRLAAEFSLGALFILRQIKQHQRLYRLAVRLRTVLETWRAVLARTRDSSA
jgi:CelD/BcsL family acetyltransferase involved in cellulose biosynthesis